MSKANYLKVLNILISVGFTIGVSISEIYGLCFLIVKTSLK